MSLDDQKSSASNTSTHTTGLIMLALSAICILLALKIFKGRKRDVLVLIALGLAVAAFYVLANPQSTEKHYEKDNVENAYGEVSLRIDCSVVFDHWEELDETLKDGDYWPKDGIILERSEYSIEEGDTAFDVLLDAVTQNKIHIDYQGGDANIYNTVYIEGIQYLYEFSCGKLSGWTYAVNGSFPDVGCSSYVLSDGDFVEWMYTYDLGRDVGNLFEGEGE
ncbi:MAG: DUF4430 domain-containing protein [Clostridia bacterium]|nr:DUF4430 domain-containing protein [Clostridia bacterium]